MASSKPEKIDSDKKFVDDQCGVVMTVDTINLPEFMDYFLNNFERLHLDNVKETKIAILFFHGSKGGTAGRLDLDEELVNGRIKTFMEHKRFVREGGRYGETGTWINGLKYSDPDCPSRYMNFKLIDLFGAKNEETKPSFDQECEEWVIKQLNEFNPTLIVMHSCNSLFNEASLALRRSGLFSRIIAQKDLSLITGEKTVRLSEEQNEVFNAFNGSQANFSGVKRFKNLFLWGHPGTGKTLLAELWNKQMIDEMTDQRSLSNLEIYMIPNFHYSTVRNMNSGEETGISKDIGSQYEIRQMERSLS